MIGVVLLERENPHSKLARAGTIDTMQPLLQRPPVQEEADWKGDHRREDGNQPVFRARWDSLVRQFEGEPADQEVVERKSAREGTTQGSDRREARRWPVGGQRWRGTSLTHGDVDQAGLALREAVGFLEDGGQRRREKGNVGKEDG